ncbi:MAG: hypothetical protein ACI9XZ_000669 [Alphaproteobacteria bacterium]|jgi:hypothetical protein
MFEGAMTTVIANSLNRVSTDGANPNVQSPTITTCYTSSPSLIPRRRQHSADTRFVSQIAPQLAKNSDDAIFVQDIVRL